MQHDRPNACALHDLPWGRSRLANQADWTRADAGKNPFDDVYLFSFGELLIPRHLWRGPPTLCDVWIEPALISEWSRLMNSYAWCARDEMISEAKISTAMTWSEL